MFRRCLPLAGFLLALSIAACTNKTTPAQPTPPTPTVGAPAVQAPVDGQTLDTLRPTLRVGNATTSVSDGTRTYDFQVADNPNFTIVPSPIEAAAVVVQKTGVPEGSGGRTEFTVEQDLTPTTTYHWRARMIQVTAAGTTTGPWSTTARFTSKPGEPLVTAPVIDAPADDEQLNTLRPTLRVRNATSSQDGVRSYQFQVADNPGMTVSESESALTDSLVVVDKPDVPEGGGGVTSYTLEKDLAPGTRFWWRARLVSTPNLATSHGTFLGPWSNVARFRSRVNNATLGQPRVESPTDDQQLDTLRPQVRFANATSDQPQGTRTYDIQISPDSTFNPASLSAVEGFVVSITDTVAEGTGGTTTFRVDEDLQPVTRYFVRVRARQGTTVGPWSATSRFRTKIQSFQNGNTVYDVLTDGKTLGATRDVAFFLAGEPMPGLKLNHAQSYLSYEIGSLDEGEVSFHLYRVKNGDSTFIGQNRILTLQDGFGPFASSPFRVLVDKRPPNESSRVQAQFNGSSLAMTGGLSWNQDQNYFWRLQWARGSARLRVFENNESGRLVVDLTMAYAAPFTPDDLIVTIGSRENDTCRDIRVSGVYISPFPRPVSLGSALIPQ